MDTHLIYSIVAAVDGSRLAHKLVAVLLVGLCVAIVWALGSWLIEKLFSAPPIATTVWNGLFLVLLALFIVNFLLGLTGHPLFHY